MCACGWRVLRSPRRGAEGGKASRLPAECRSTRRGFNQEQSWESLPGPSVELLLIVPRWEQKIRRGAAERLNEIWIRLSSERSNKISDQSRHTASGTVAVLVEAMNAEHMALSPLWPSLKLTHRWVFLSEGKICFVFEFQTITYGHCVSSTSG